MRDNWEIRALKRRLNRKFRRKRLGGVLVPMTVEPTKARPSAWVYPKPDKSDRPLTTEEAAEYLGLRPKTLINYRSEKRHILRRTGPNYILTNEGIAYTLKDLDTYKRKRLEYR